MKRASGGKAGRRGAVKDGGKAVTIYEVARIAGVSATTVSSVLNGKHPERYTAATGERVRRAAERLGFRWNATARSLRSRRAYRLQILAPNWHDILVSDYHMRLIQGIADESQRRGYEVMLTLVDFKDWKENAGVTRALSRRDVDGHFIVPDEFADVLPRDIKPTALCGMRPSLRNRHLAYVDCDNREGARQATRYLVAHGHRKILHLAGYMKSSSGVERRAGYEEAMREAGLKPQVLDCGFSDQNGYDVGMLLCDTKREETAVFAANDHAALGLLRALAERGRRVPADVALVGFDGIPAGRIVHPSLTSVVQPVAEIGREAVRLVCGRIEGGGGEPAERLLAPTLWRGGSA